VSSEFILKQKSDDEEEREKRKNWQ